MGRKSDYGNGMYQQLQEIMGRLEKVEKDSKQKIDTLNSRIDTLEKENQNLKEENQLLREDNARLKSIINNDSSNTSLPPSSDQKGGKPANTFNGRIKTGRKAGAQKGHKGTSLTKADAEAKIRSGRCRHEIRELGTASGTYVTKYVLDLDITPSITEIHIYADETDRIRIPAEYRSDVTYGPNVKALAVGLYSEGVMSNDRIAAFLNAASDGELELSEGSVYNFCKIFSKKTETSIVHLAEELRNQSVVATDATVVMVNGEQNYIRNFSTDSTVIYHALNAKTLETMRIWNF